MWRKMRKRRTDQRGDGRQNIDEDDAGEEECTARCMSRERWWDGAEMEGWTSVRGGIMKGEQR